MVLSTLVLQVSTMPKLVSHLLDLLALVPLYSFSIGLIPHFGFRTLLVPWTYFSSYLWLATSNCLWIGPSSSKLFHFGLLILQIWSLKVLKMFKLVPNFSESRFWTQKLVNSSNLLFQSIQSSSKFLIAFQFHPFRAN